MKDEHYYQRLTQIRQKYGYFNEINSNQYPQRSTPLRLDTKQINQPNNLNLFPPKSTKSRIPDDHLQNHYDRIDTKRYQEKTLTSPHPHLAIPTKNISHSVKAELAMQQTKRITEREKQSQIPPRIPVNRCLPSPSIKHKEETSPIRNYQGMFIKSPQYDITTQSPTGRSFSPRHIPNLQNSYQDKFLNTDRIITKIGMQAQTRFHTPSAKREPLRQQINSNIQTQANDARKNEDKYNTNIQNIGKIQERIQAALNKNKAVK